MILNLLRHVMLFKALSQQQGRENPIDMLTKAVIIEKLELCVASVGQGQG